MYTCILKPYESDILSASYRDGCLSPNVNLTKASALGNCEESLCLWDHDSGLGLKGLNYDSLRTPQFCYQSPSCSVGPI